MTKLHRAWASLWGGIDRAQVWPTLGFAVLLVVLGYGIIALCNLIGKLEGVG